MKVFSTQYICDLLNAAKKSQRLRSHSNIHESYEDKCQKFFNAIRSDSYICPHRHSPDSRDECLIAIKGLFGLITFNNVGIINSIVLFGGEIYAEKLSIATGVNLPAATWHTVVSLVDSSVLFEVKEGPFLPHLAKELADWAPKEGEINASDFLASLKQACLRELKVKNLHRF